MNLNFDAPTQISFETEVVGTNAPTEMVCVVITNGAESFTKKCSLVDNRWEVTIPEFKLLDSYISGIKQFLIEFKINGRIFTPYKKEVSFNLPEPIIPKAPETVAQEEPSNFEQPTVDQLDNTNIQAELDAVEQALTKPTETYTLFKGLSTEQEEKKPTPVKEVKIPKKEFTIKKFDDKQSIDVKPGVSKSDFMFDDIKREEVVTTKPTKQIKENIFIKIHKTEVIYL